MISSKNDALVTGSHKSICFAIARQLARRDDIHVIVTSRKESDGVAAQQQSAAEEI